MKRPRSESSVGFDFSQVKGYDDEDSDGIAELVIPFDAVLHAIIGERLDARESYGSIRVPLALLTPDVSSERPDAKEPDRFRVESVQQRNLLTADWCHRQKPDAGRCTWHPDLRVARKDELRRFRVGVRLPRTGNQHPQLVIETMLANDEPWQFSRH